MLAGYLARRWMEKGMEALFSEIEYRKLKWPFFHVRMIFFESKTPRPKSVFLRNLPGYPIVRHVVVKAGKH